MKSFLVQAIEQIQANHDAWEEVVIILPSKRAGVYFNHHLLQHVQTTQIAPAVHSIESFVATLSSLKKAPQIHQIFTLYQEYTALLDPADRDDFSTFLLWGKRLLNDFNDLDAYRINPREILEDLGEFYRIESVFAEEDKRSFSPSFWRVLPQLYENFENALLESNWGTLGMLYKDTLDSLELYLTHTAKTHYFIGFNALNKAEQDLLQGFLVEKKGTVLWDLDCTLYEDQFHAAGRFIRHYQKTWPYYRQNPLRFKEVSFSTKKEIKSTGFSGNIAQAQYVGKLLEKKETTTATTAVVFGNEQLLLPVLAHLPERINNWNVTMGYAIEQLPMTQWFLTLVSLHANYTDDGFDREQLLHVLSFSPFKNYTKTLGEAFHKLHKTLTQNFASKVSLNTLAPLLKSVLGKALLHPADHPTVLIDQLIYILTQFTETTKLFDAMSLAVIETIMGVLAQIRVQLETVNFDVSSAAFFVLLKESIALQTLDFKGDPIEGVQLMGMLESRVLDFDRIIITNVNEGILPVGKNDQSFFPFAMKKKYGLPTFLDNDAIYTYHFYRLLQRAKEIHLLYNAKSEGLNAGEKSRFIRQLELLTPANHAFSDEQYPLHLPNVNVSPPEVIKTPHMMERLEHLAAKGFSPTSLTTYLNDPITFYDRYILGVKDPEVSGKVISDLTRGTLIHDCVEQLYTPYIGRVLHPKDYDEMCAKLPATLATLYAKTYPEMPEPKGENFLILSAYERGIEQFLKEEKKLIVAGNELIITGLEKEFSVPLQDCVDGKEIVIRGKIDRVDQYNGVTRLIDYKTGKVEKSKLSWINWESFVGDYKRNALFQLLLYAWAYLENENCSSIEVGVISFKSPKEIVMPLLRKNLPKGSDLGKVDHSFAVEIHNFILQLIQELFDLEKSFVSLKEGK